MKKSNENRGENILNFASKKSKQVNQQVNFILKKNGREKFAYFLAGFFEGEGSLWASVNYQPKLRINIRINIGFSITQHISGLPLLYSCKYYFQTGRIYLKNNSNDVYVFEINDRTSIREKVFPFLENYVLPLGCKFNDQTTWNQDKQKSILIPGTFSLIKELVTLFDQKKHLEPNQQGIIRCIEIVYLTNPLGKGKKRKRSLEETITLVKQSRLWVSDSSPSQL